jgi:UDP-GlcNAc:undecaprenyl-phosphate GlcNAc-1-phosphate transferase
MLKYLILFCLASVSSLLLTPLIRFIAIKLGAIDQPGERKVHSKPTPRLGGFAIFISFHLILLIASQFEFFYFPPGFLQDVKFWWVLVASAIVLSLGAADDFRRMPPSIKFFFQIIAGLIVTLAGYKIEVIDLPFGTIQLGILSVPVTILWMVAITNSINLLDGLDGLAAGTSLLTQSIEIALISIILVGSILGFVKYNFHPASIFLGDSGAYFLGFKLAILSLQGGLKGTTTIAILIPIIALGLPIMDTALSMFRRLLKSLHIMEVDQEKNMIKFFYLDGWSMFRADRQHIHHRLLQIGLTQKKAVVILYGVSLIFGGIALSSVYFKSINYALLLTAIAVASYIGIRKLGYREVQILSNGVLLPLFDTPVINRRILRVFVDLAIISLSYYFAFLLRFEGDFGQVKDYYLTTLPLVLTAKTVVFHITGLYRGAWRYTNINDLMRMVKAVVFGSIASALLLWMIPDFGIYSRAVLLIDFNLLLFFVVGARSSFRILEYLNTTRNHNGGRSILIYGVGKSGTNALREFIHNPTLGLSPIGFIDDDQRNKGKQVNGYPVIGTLESLEGILKKNSVSEVILAINEFPRGKLERLSKICAVHQIPLRRFQTNLEDIVTAEPQNGKTEVAI